MTTKSAGTISPLIPVILAALAMIGPFSIDTYLPAFPAIATDLGATQLENVDPQITGFRFAVANRHAFVYDKTARTWNCFRIF